jgi:hypothetical protein
LRQRGEFEATLAGVQYGRYRETPALAVADAVFGTFGARKKHEGGV